MLVQNCSGRCPWEIVRITILLSLGQNNWADTLTNDEMEENSLSRVRHADTLHKKIIAMSASFFRDDDIEEIERFRKEADLLLGGIRGTDAVIGIFDHLNYTPVLEVGEKEFWGNLPEVPKEERMPQIMSFLEKEYLSFFTDSVKWLTGVLEKIPFDRRKNIQIFHCGIRYTLL